MLWRLWRLDCQSIVRACIPFPYTAFYQSFFIFSDSLGGAASHYIDEKTPQKPRCHSHSLHIFGRNQVRIVTIQAIINAGHQRTSGKVVGPNFLGRECEVYERCVKNQETTGLKKNDVYLAENWRWEWERIEDVNSKLKPFALFFPIPSHHWISWPHCLRATW